MQNVINRICSARDAAEHASSILKELEDDYLRGESLTQPNTRSYNTVMDGWNKSRVKDNPHHIQDLFLKMKNWSTHGVENETEGLVHADVRYWEHIKPNAQSYAIVIESHRRRAFGNKIGEIEELVEGLEREYEESKDPQFKPDVVLANAMIKSYMRNADYTSGGGGKYQQSMATTSWKTAKKINDIYIQWNKKFKNTGDAEFKPNVITLTMVIDAYARCGDIAATEKAELVFQNMVKEWEETGDERMKPSSKTFTAVSKHKRNHTSQVNI